MPSLYACTFVPAGELGSCEDVRWLTAASSTTSPTATHFPADEPTRRRRLLDKIAEAARAGVDYIQLREKDLPTRELESLAREAIASIRETEN